MYHCKEITGRGGLCPHASTTMTTAQYKHTPTLWEPRQSTTLICDREQVAQPGPQQPLRATTHNSRERSHPTYNMRRKKRACVPIRRNPIRRSGRIGQSSVRRDLAGGSKQSRNPFQRTTVQTSPKLSSRNTSYYYRERKIRIRA